MLIFSHNALPSHYTLNSLLLSYFSAGETVAARGSHIGYLSTESKTSLAWLDVYAAENGDQMPDIPKIHLPMCSTVDSIYQDMIEELHLSEVVSKSHFYTLWRTHRPDIAIPKVFG